MSDLTGQDADRDDNSPFGGPSLEDVQQQLADGHPVTIGTRDDAGFWWWQDDDDERVDGGKLVSDHEYIVKEVKALPDGSRQIVLLNPWGAERLRGVRGQPERGRVSGVYQRGVARLTPLSHRWCPRHRVPASGYRGRDIRLAGIGP